MSSVAVGDLAKLLECPVCLKIATVPGRLCETGHPICGSCASDLDSCPCCEGPILAGYNSFLQKIAVIVPRPCDYSEVGCKVKDVPDVLEDHKQFCEFLPLKCCVSLCQCTECDFVGLWSKHWQHVTEDHLEWARQQLRLEDVKINIRPGINTCYYILAFGKVFCCFITFHSDSSLMCVKIVQHLRKEEEQVFLWDMKITDEDNKGCGLLLNGVTTYLMNASQDCLLKVPYEQLFGFSAESMTTARKTSRDKQYSCTLCIKPAKMDENTEGSSQLSPGDSTLMQSLMKVSECPVCLEMARVPSTLCTTGHILCEACSSKLTSCPLCKSEFLGRELLFVKNVMQMVPRPCHYWDLGCPVTDKGESLERHEMVCRFITWPCAVYTFKMAECDWKGRLSEYWAHVAESHSECAREPDEMNKIVTTLYRDQKTYVCLKAYGEVFDCLFYPTNEVETFCVYLWLRSPGASRFSWQLEFSTKNETRGTLLFSDMIVSQMAKHLDDYERLPWACVLHHPYSILKKFKHLSGPDEHYPCTLSVYLNTQG